MENEYPIAARAITKCYGRKRLALDAVTLTVRAGEVYALVGENGAGKSTLMHIVVGLSRATSGTLSLFGRTDARGLRASRARIGYVPDECGAYQNMSARDNLAVRCAEWNLPKSEIEQALRLVDLADTGRLKVKRFSMGMKRRLDIATALLGNSELIVMDEPINGLDPLGVVEMREVIRRLHREEGKTILISSHNLDELQKVSTCYGFISHGRMLQEASSDELARRCALGFKLDTDDQARTIELLARAYPSASVTPCGRDAVLVQGAEEHFDPEDAVARLAAAGVRIREARFESLALEDYYRALMQGEGLEPSMDRDENGVRAAA